MRDEAPQTAAPTAPAVEIHRTGPGRPTAVLLALVLVVALAFRWPGMSASPYDNRDELNYVPKALRYGSGDLNPHYFHNPPFASYLMFAATGADYLRGRATGAWSSPLEYKARFLSGTSDAFVASRFVSLVAGLATVGAAAWLCGLLGGWASPASRTAPLLAALGVACSSMAVERSHTATNEMLATLFYTLATGAAVVVALRPTFRAAAAAGALVGLAAGAKYTGVLVCVPVAAACLSAGGLSLAPRVRLLGAAALSAVAAFLVVCPWAILDQAMFLSHVRNQAGLGDRYEDGRAWERYLGALWQDGFGPVWCALLGVAVVVAVGAAFRRSPLAAERRAARIALCSVAALFVFLALNTHLAYGRYLLPALPAAFAVAAWSVSAGTVSAGTGAAGTWIRRAAVVAVVATAAWRIPAVCDAYARAARPDTHDVVLEWVRRNIPAGEHVVVDLHAPRLITLDDQREFEGRVGAATWERLTPAYRVTHAIHYFAGPLDRLEGTDIPVDDFARLRARGRTWFVVSDLGERVFQVLPPGDRPAERWYRAIRAETALVFEATPGPDLTGPPIRVHRLE